MALSEQDRLDQKALDTIDFDGVGEARAEQRAQAKSSMAGAIGTNPDQHADNLRISDQTGLAPDVVDRNKQRLLDQQALDTIDFDAVLDDAPEASDWVKTRDNAKLAVDDFSFFGRMKKTFHDIPEAGASNPDKMRLIDLNARELSGDKLTPAEMVERDVISNMFDNEQLGTGGWVSSGAIGTMQSTQQMGTAIAKGGAGAAIGAGAGALFGTAVAGFTGQVEAIPAAALGGGRLGGTIGGATGMALENYRQQSAMTYNDLRRMKDETGKPLDPALARGASQVVGVLNAGLDSIGLEKIMETVPGFDLLKGKLTREGIKKAMKVPGMREALTRIGGKYATAIGVEGMTEAGQEMVSIIGEETAKASSGDRYESTDFDTIKSRVGGNLIGGAVGGGVFGAPGTALGISRTYNRADRIRAVTPEQVAQHVEGINAAVQGSKLYQRSPDRFSDLMQSLAPDERFYLDGKVAADTVAKLSDEDRGKLFNAIPTLKDEIDHAAASGADVSMTKADYASYIAPTAQAAALVPHIKLDPQDMSLAERGALSEFLAKNPGAAAEIGGVLDTSPDAAPEETYSAVTRIIKRALMDGGKRSTVEASALAPLFARTISRFAAPFGENAVDSIAANLLHFEAVDDEGNPIASANTGDALLGDLEQVRAGKRIANGDPALHDALTRFGAKMDAAGITVEQAKQMGARALFEKIKAIPETDPNAESESILDHTMRGDKVTVSLSAATKSIEGIRALAAAADAGDTQAAATIHSLAENSLRNLMSGLKSVNLSIDKATGLYGGELEPSLRAEIEFDDNEREQVLSRLARFGKNFNQDQIHVRQETADSEFGNRADGGYVAHAYRIYTDRALDRAAVQHLIDASGLFGLTVGDGYVESYFVGNPDDESELDHYRESVKTLINTIGADARRVDFGPERIRIYGRGEGAESYQSLARPFRIEGSTDAADANARVIGERYFGHGVDPVIQPKTVAERQTRLQRTIALEYENLPDNDMDNPIVRRSYEELATEVQDQYRALPIKVTVFTGEGEPYADSAAMRRDVRGNNHMWFKATTPDAFGPPGSDFSGHPLLAETDIYAGKHRMLANDLFQVVHDYYAHNLSATSFGPIGEEAAWRNHMGVTKSPWARWALTAETRGQNSWVNYRPGAEQIFPLIERGFARQKAALLPIEYTLTGEAGVDKPVLDLIDELNPEQREGSLTVGQRASAEIQVDGEESQTLHQRERGSITFGPAVKGDYAAKFRNVVIAFTQSSNFSTGAHEFAHWAVAAHRLFAEMARDRIAQGDDSHEIRRISEDWEKLKAEVGATGDTFTVEQEEHVAKMFESYMRDGKAPSEDLRRIFTRFRDWLTKIYRDTIMLGGQASPEISGIFDRWIASENEIAKVQARNGQLADIAQALGLPESITDRVADYVNSAMMKGEESLYRKLDQEQAKRETQAYKDQFDATRADVSAEFADKREYRLIQYLRDNGWKLLAGPETEGIPQDVLSDDENAETTLHPDQIADLFGYDSGMRMTNALKNTPSFDGAVDYETRQRLLKKFPDMIAEGRITNEAVPAIVNDRTLLALDLMIREMKRANGMSAVGFKQFAKSIAQAAVAEMTIRDSAYAFRYDVARSKELRHSLEAARGGDPEKAVLHLQRAMVAHQTFKLLTDFGKVRDKAEALFERVNRKDKKLAPSSDIDYIGAARALLVPFGLAREGFNVQTWLDDLQERDPDTAADLIGLSAIFRATPKPVADMSIAEFTDLYNGVENLLHMARRSKEFEIGTRKLRIEQAVAELSGKLSCMKETAPLEGTQVHGRAFFNIEVSGLKAMMRRVEHWARGMDGDQNGPFQDLIFRPVSKAGVEYREARAAWLSRLNEVFAEHKDYLGKQGKIETGMPKDGGVSLTFRDRLEAIGFLLHTGNDSNLDKLLGGYGIDPGDYESAMLAMQKDGRLTKEDFVIVQKLWDLAEDLKPLSQRTHRRLYGYRFDEIENRPVETKFGTFRGGYWPAVVDYQQVTNEAAQKAALSDAKQFMLPSTGRGFTKGRVQAYKKPLSTDLRLASSHIDQVLRFVYVEPTIKQVSSLVNNRDFAAQLKRVDSQAQGGMLVPWLARSAKQITAAPPPLGTRGDSRLGKTWTFMRTSASAQTIMLNVANALQNVTNFSVVAHEVGGRNFAKAFADYLAAPIESGKAIREMSALMRVRQDVVANDVENEIDLLVGRRTALRKFKNLAIKHGYIFQRLSQNLIDNVAWQAAYNRALEEDRSHEQAIEDADSVIRRTQGSGAPEDISSIEAGSPGAKLFTQFYGFFNAQANYIGTRASVIMREKGWAGAPDLFMLYLMTVAIPGTVGAMVVDGLRGNAPKDDDDDGQVLDDWLAYMAMTQFKYVNAFVPYVGQVANAVVNGFNKNPLDDRVSLTPFSGFVSTGVGLIDGTFKDHDRDPRKLTRDIFSTVGFTTGLPLGQIGKTAAYGVGLAAGKEHPKSPLDIAKGLLAGPMVQKKN